MCGCLAICISTVTGWQPFRVLLPFAAPTWPFALCLSVWNVESMWMLERWRVVFYWSVLKQVLNTICFSCVVIWANQYQYKQEHTRGYNFDVLWCSSYMLSDQSVFLLLGFLYFVVFHEEGWDLSTMTLQHYKPKLCILLYVVIWLEQNCLKPWDFKKY